MGRPLVRCPGRKVDAHRRPPTGGAVDANVAAMARDDAVDDRQPEPGAFADRLRREERLEGAPPRFLVHAAAGVRHRQAELGGVAGRGRGRLRSEEHTSELKSLMRISYAVFCLKKKNTKHTSREST